MLVLLHQIKDFMQTKLNPQMGCQEISNASIDEKLKMFVIPAISKTTLGFSFL